MIKTTYFIFALLLLFVSCQEVDDSAQNGANPITETGGDSEIIRIPKEVVEKDGVKVGLYTYDAFQKYLEAENDTTYVVNFWATWCKPCVEELPSFEQLYEKYKDKKVRLILVSLDFEKQIESKLIPFINENKLKGEVLVLQQKGMNDWIDKIDPSWSGA